MSNRFRYLRAADADLTNHLRFLAKSDRKMRAASNEMRGLEPNTLDFLMAERRHQQAADRYRHVLSEVCATPALTEEGRIAKARLLQSFSARFDENTDPLAMVARSLAADIAGMPQQAA